MKTAVITGVTSGIGQAIAGALVERGWTIVGLSRQDADLRDPEQVKDLGKRLSKDLDKIDALIHVAGVWHGKSKPHINKDLEDYGSKAIMGSMMVGVVSFMMLAGKLLPRMPKDGVVMGVSGTFEDGANGWLPYYASKRALEDFLVGLAQDYPTGPKVYGISPSDTATPAYKKFYPKSLAAAQSPKAVGQIAARIISGESSYLGGQIITIKNGKTAAGLHR